MGLHLVDWLVGLRVGKKGQMWVVLKVGVLVAMKGSVMAGL